MVVVLDQYRQLIKGKETLVCYLNKLVETKPQNHPILIIRKLIDIKDETLFACLVAMEQIKEHKIWCGLQ